MLTRASLLLAGAVLFASPVRAVCLDPQDLSKYHRPSVADEAKSSVAIVIGEVAKEQGLREDPSDPGGWTSFIYTVRVSERLKGKTPDRILMKVQNDSGGYRMTPRQTHLLFLAKNGRFYTADSCGNSTELPKGDNVVKRVRELLAASSMRPNSTAESDARKSGARGSP